MLFSPFLGLFSEKLVEEQPLDDDGLASQQSRGGDGGSGGSGGGTRPPAAVNAMLTGSTMGAGAPETERRQHARARTTKPITFMLSCLCGRSTTVPCTLR